MNQKYLILISFALIFSLFSNGQNKKASFKFVPQIVNLAYPLADSSYYINQVKDGHLGFPDIIKLKDKRLLVIYRQGKSHVDSSGKIMKQYGSADGISWSKPELFFDNPSLDERDMSITTLKNGKIAFNYFGSIGPGKKDRPWQIFTYFGYLNEKDNSVDIKSLVQIDNNKVNNKSFSVNKSGYWINETGEVVSYEGVSSPVVEDKNKLILATYGGNPIVKTPNDSNRTFSRISLFESKDGGKKWEKREINPKQCSMINLQEPCLLNIDGKRMLIHIRTQVEKKYSSKDKMMQAVSNDGGITWTEWKAFDFVGHAPYLIQLKNGIIISAYRDFDPPSGKEGAAFIYSKDKGENWSKPIVFDTPRVDNDSSYPSIQELEDNKFIIVYYTDNGKAIKGKIYRIVN